MPNSLWLEASVKLCVHRPVYKCKTHYSTPKPLEIHGVVKEKKKKRMHSYASRHVIIGVIQQPLQCLVKPKSVPVLVLYTAGNALENQMIFRIDTA